MKKADLKRILLPIVKECINEILLQEGMLSTIVSEVASGMGNKQIINEQKTSSPAAQFQKQELERARKEAQERLNPQRKRLAESAGLPKEIFDVEPMAADSNSITGLNENDPGINIDSLMSMFSKK